MSSQVASHRVGKKLVDVIFGASAACAEAVKEHGADKVTNATIGANDVALPLSKSNIPLLLPIPIPSINNPTPTGIATLIQFGIASTIFRLNPVTVIIKNATPAIKLIAIP